MTNLVNVCSSKMNKLNLLIIASLTGLSNLALAGSFQGNPNFPRPLDSYEAMPGAGVLDILSARVAENPFNLIATIIFVLAICHTFCASYFMKLSHDIQHKHVQKRIKEGTIGTEHDDVSFLAQILHYFGEVEAIFGIWVIALVGAIWSSFGLNTVIDYVGHKVNFTEPAFVVVIMTLAATRPILNFTENCLKLIAKLGKGSSAAWWLTILTVAPILGSFITEPAAMTIAALLLGKQFYAHRPSKVFEYATLGLLFVNISVGGTLTNFAAPPVLMVAAPWEWSSAFMMEHFGWKAVVGIITSNIVYFLIFKKEFKQIEENAKNTKHPTADDAEVTSSDQSNLVPFWVTAVHIAFMAWTVFMAHYPVLFIGGFLFFIGFYTSTPQHQNKLELKAAMLVGFFLAGLVIHGGLQAWWIAPVLSSFGETSLMLVATVLTGFNDNAAITYLSTLVPNFSDSLKYAVMAGAVTGGGLTVIANAPNPAGQAILSKYFKNKTIKPLYLLLGAIIPTIILGLSFMLLR
jgi:hypothetical protein